MATRTPITMAIGKLSSEGGGTSSGAINTHNYQLHDYTIIWDLLGFSKTSEKADEDEVGCPPLLCNELEINLAIIYEMPYINIWWECSYESPVGKSSS